MNLSHTINFQFSDHLVNLVMTIAIITKNSNSIKK
jgi:hypothetical protein